MKEIIDQEQLSELIINSLNFQNVHSHKIRDFIRPNAIPNFTDRLKLNFDGRYSDSINDYLDSVNQKEMSFFRFFEKQIPLTDSMNPHNKPYKLKDYFVEKTERGTLKHLKLLYDLLKKDENNILRLKENQGILHLGEKGSGKTFSQNVWLHENNELLEKNKIFWVRLDATKLIKIWDDSPDINNPNLTTIEEYFLGQIVYVFCKHFIGEFPMRNKLFVEIANKLLRSENNIIQEPVLDSKFKADESITPEDIFAYYAHRKGFKTIIEYLKDIERQIAISEGFNSGKNKRLESGKRIYSDKSFLVEKVLIDSQKFSSDRHKGSKRDWMVLGNILKKFILTHGYSFLYIIDGMENINYQHENHKNYIDKIFIGLYEFPLNQLNSYLNEFVLISLRDNTYESLKRITVERNYDDFIKYKDVEAFTKIWQDTSGLQRLVFDKRIKYVLQRIKCDDCFMLNVIKAMIDYHSIPDEKRWNSNFRCFMYNHLNLAKLITFRYYFAGQPKNFDIEEQIDTFENINFFLNGELFINELTRNPASNKGYNLFNLFGYVEETTNNPSYLIFPRLLQIIGRRPSISEKRLLIDTENFDYNENDIRICLDKLVWSGLIKSTYSPNTKDKVKILLTAKGKFALNVFFNDIHYLYYASLDTLLPGNVIQNIKISPNNFNEEKSHKKMLPSQ